MVLVDLVILSEAKDLYPESQRFLVASLLGMTGGANARDDMR